MIVLLCLWDCVFAFLVSNKISISVIFAFLHTVCPFLFMVAFKITYPCLKVILYVMSLCSFHCVLCAWILWNILDLCVYSFYQISKHFGIVFFLSPALSGTPITCILCIFKLSQSSLMLFLFLFQSLLSLCFIS